MPVFGRFSTMEHRFAMWNNGTGPVVSSARPGIAILPSPDASAFRGFAWCAALVLAALAGLTALCKGGSEQLFAQSRQAMGTTKTATAVTRAYYSATDGRFTRWGKFSKVLVPRTAAALQPVLTAAGRLFSVAGWVLIAAEGVELTQGCASQIQ